MAHKIVLCNMYAIDGINFCFVNVTYPFNKTIRETINC